MERVVVLGTAATTLRSIETQPFDWMICLVSLTSHPSAAEFDSFVSRPPRPSALSLIFQATAALGKLSSLGADTDTGYKLQHKPGRLGIMLQPLSSRLPSERATNVQAEHHRAV